MARLDGAFSCVNLARDTTRGAGALGGLGRPPLVGSALTIRLRRGGCGQEGLLSGRARLTPFAARRS